MKKYFIFKDSNSHEFWNIQTEGTSLTVHYGKIDSAGQSEKKNFDSEAICTEEADKLILAKQEKGYEEVSKDESAKAKIEVRKFFLSGDEIYDEGRDCAYLVEKILKDEHLAELKYLTIGCFGGWEDGCQPILNMIAENKEKFQQAEYLFVGDMDYEECEVSWIIQGNYEKIYDALPNLKTLKIKGSNDLSLGKLKHDKLEHLEIICGGLGQDVIKEISKGELPNLKTLILYMGVEDYGYDGTADDLKPLMSKELFPNLSHLGLVDSEEQDEITKLVLESDILPQLSVLQLCYGTLSDAGGQMILDGEDKISHLKLLDLEHHYMSEGMMKNLEKLPVSVNLADAKGEDDEYRYPMLTE